jgi:hypothetical protein
LDFLQKQHLAGMRGNMQELCHLDTRVFFMPKRQGCVVGWFGVAAVDRQPLHKIRSVVHLALRHKGGIAGPRPAWGTAAELSAPLAWYRTKPQKRQSNQAQNIAPVSGQGARRSTAPQNAKDFYLAAMPSNPALATTPSCSALPPDTPIAPMILPSTTSGKPPSTALAPRSVNTRRPAPPPATAS